MYVELYIVIFVLEAFSMLCPHCGRWNRETLPKCFYCGYDFAALQKNSINGTDAKPSPEASSAVIYSISPDGVNSSPRPDEKDMLAREMQSFHSRRKRGEDQQSRIRQEVAASSGMHTTRSVRYDTQESSNPSEPADMNIPVPVQGSFTETAEAPSFKRNIPPSNEPDSDDPSDSQPLWSDDFNSRPRAKGMYKYRMKHVHLFGARRFFSAAAVITILAALLFVGYHYILLPALSHQSDTEETKAEVIPSILNDMAAHTVRIPADEGAQIYIKELRKSYIAAGGYAEFTVADYVWYELESNIESETMEVSLTPYIKTSAGEQKLLDTINYTIEIPLSPLVLVSPDTDYTEVSTSPYNVQFRVAQNSSVFINGEDYSSYVNTRDGYISYNAQVSAIGENRIEIVVNCQYYRQNKKTIILYRAPQDIPLELDSTLGDTSAFDTMTIRGTTLPGVTLSIGTAYEDLNTEELNTRGKFSFKAKFTKIGTNDIIIRVEKDGLYSELIKKVYYVPYASTYTPKAWPMDSANYIDFLNNTNMRVSRTQIYVCIGTITEILSGKPQLALMDTGTDGSERLVLLENMSGETWEVGGRYRVYADAYGIYDGKPRLVGRYTYGVKN